MTHNMRKLDIHVIHMTQFDIRMLIQHLICLWMTTNQFTLDVCGGILSPLEAFSRLLVLKW